MLFKQQFYCNFPSHLVHFNCHRWRASCVFHSWEERRRVNRFANKLPPKDNSTFKALRFWPFPERNENKLWNMSGPEASGVKLSPSLQSLCLGDTNFSHLTNENINLKLFLFPVSARHWRRRFVNHLTRISFGSSIHMWQAKESRSPLKEKSEKNCNFR